MKSIVKQLVWVLTAIAFLSGAMVPWLAGGKAFAAPGTGVTASANCDMMDMSGTMADDMAGHGSDVDKSAPCKSMTLDCMMQMGCLGLSGAILANLESVAAPIRYRSVIYGSQASAGSGLSTAPDPFPPKTLV